MSTIILKPERDEDFYVLWSTITDCPGFRGTRAEVEVALRGSQHLYGDNSHDWTLKQRFDRADSTGTSSFTGLGSWRSHGLGVNWDAQGEVEVGRRWLPREKLGPWLRTGDESLTEPLPY